MKNKNLKNLIQRSNEGSSLELNQARTFEVLNPEMDNSIRGGDLKACDAKVRTSSCGVLKGSPILL